jgi:hypothetical protein
VVEGVKEFIIKMEFFSYPFRQLHIPKYVLSGPGYCPAVALVDSILLLSMPSDRRAP